MFTNRLPRVTQVIKFLLKTKIIIYGDYGIFTNFSEQSKVDWKLDIYWDVSLNLTFDFVIGLNLTNAYGLSLMIFFSFLGSWISGGWYFGASKPCSISFRFSKRRKSRINLMRNLQSKRSTLSFDSTWRYLSSVYCLYLTCTIAESFSMSTSSCLLFEIRHWCNWQCRDIVI